MIDPLLNTSEMKSRAPSSSHQEQLESTHRESTSEKPISRNENRHLKRLHAAVSMSGSGTSRSKACVKSLPTSPHSSYKSRRQEGQDRQKVAQGKSSSASQPHELLLQGNVDSRAENSRSLLHVSLKLLSMRESKHQPSQELCPTARREDPVFPLPWPLGPVCPGESTSSSDDDACEGWFCLVVKGLNEMYCGREVFAVQGPNKLQSHLLKQLRQSIQHVRFWAKEPLPALDWGALLKGRTVNSYGEEVFTAQPVKWGNLRKSLPDKAGSVPLVDVCEGGIRELVLNPHALLKPTAFREAMTPPQVRVANEDWPEVAANLIRRGVCSTLPLDEAFQVDGQPILSGMFGVSKQEMDNEFEVLRLIMDLRPLNFISESVSGDTDTLPLITQLIQLDMMVSEDLVVSCEDLKAMFYCFELPECWLPFTCFNKVLPPSFCPENDARPRVLCAKVLPMGHLNSVSFAQHLHRNIARKAGSMWPHANPLYRIYLDNFDHLCKVNREVAQLLEGSSPSFVDSLCAEYARLGVPRNLKKSVRSTRVCEVQGAQVYGDLGVASPKPSKIARYVQAVRLLLNMESCTQRQMQVCAGGLVYMAMYRRPLMANLNSIWSFITSFPVRHKATLPIPSAVKREMRMFLSLIPLALLRFRLPWAPSVVASDASLQGGGVTVSRSLSLSGLMASKCKVRGQLAPHDEANSILVISLFDGIGAMRMILDVLRAPVSGYISVERDPAAQRVLESFFPSSLFVPDVAEIDIRMAQSWARKFPRTKLVLVAGGPPCQGVSGLNAFRQGAEKDARSSLVTIIPQIVDLVRCVFSWAQVHFLAESVFSMSPQDRAVYSKTLGVLPYKLDAGQCSLARRPRLFWFDWQVPASQDLSISTPQTTQATDFGVVDVHAAVHASAFLSPGFSLAGGPEHRLPTFTTAQPSNAPRASPAGLEQCDLETRKKWAEDYHKFPPYQYQFRHGLVNKKGLWRLPSVEEREAILGFPKGYTALCCNKNLRKSCPQDVQNMRLSLLGNTWSVPCVAILVAALLQKYSLIPPTSAQTIVDRCTPGMADDLPSFLLRLPPKGVGPSNLKSNPKRQTSLVSKVCSLMSNKGADILLLAGTEPTPSFHRLRTSIPSRLWAWRTVCAWKWRRSNEHINVLELQALLTSLRWRVVRNSDSNCKALHLIDSMVALHICNKGRSSSHKLRSIMYRLAAWLLVSGLVPFLAYVASQENPADRPSRALPGRAKKWVKGKS